AGKLPKKSRRLLSSSNRSRKRGFRDTMKGLRIPSVSRLYLLSGAGGLRSFQAHLLIENRRGEREQANRGLFHPWADAMQHLGLKERGVPHPLMQECLEAMQQRFAHGGVAFPGLLLKERVEIGVAAIGVGARPEHVGFQAGSRVAEEPGPHEHELLQLFLTP